MSDERRQLTILGSLFAGAGLGAWIAGALECGEHVVTVLAGSLLGLGIAVLALRRGAPDGVKSLVVIVAMFFGSALGAWLGREQERWGDEARPHVFAGTLIGAALGYLAVALAAAWAKRDA